MDQILLAVAKIPAGNPITFVGIDSFLNFLLGWLSNISLTVIVLGLILTGILMIASHGDSEKFKTSRQMLKTTILGAVVILGASFTLDLIAAVISGGPNLQPVTNLVDYIITSLGDFVIGVSGTIMVVAIIINGIRMITAGENPEKFKSARQSLVNVVWGSLVILGAGLIVKMITSLFSGGQGFTLTPIQDMVWYIVISLGDFVIGLSMVVMITFIVISGIMMTMAGADEEKFKKARQMLVNVIWGSMVILGSGVILNTILAIVNRSFFCRIQIIGICLWG
ncbi:MAG: hypothetical protein A3I39_02475 [Candidatus Yanofskybacteria bacterium RIFCSPLOWO2_02_FULL_47_9b]|uniref:Uncharacterized protein n=1 Tax=Candidatus Yanofskybacteria bacterium RIFCSPLOWO2_02_FULL_47_9b TaxID=1802708 RepID=A0A1F8H581_9BACT|nr:MAG: hypothetical protein A3I39_02475 [Candidatus Yanofskybacteria bacterium RIFCSPLOWO2_02_FULL_47_9b]